MPTCFLYCEQRSRDWSFGHFLQVWEHQANRHTPFRTSKQIAQLCRASHACFKIQPSPRLEEHVIDLVQKLQRTEHQQRKNQKSYTCKRKAISQTRINQLKAGKRGKNAQRSSCICKKCKKGGEIHHLHTPQRLHSSDASLPSPSSQGVPQYSSKQRTGDELNVNKYPQGVESFVTKKHSWEERGLVISLSKKLYRQEKKDNGRRMGSLGKDLRSGLIICAYSPGEGLEYSSGGVQQELCQGALRRPISVRNQGISP